MVQDKLGEWQMVRNMGEHEKVRQLDSHREFIDERVEKHGYVNGHAPKSMDEAREQAQKLSAQEKEEMDREARQKARRADAYKDLVMQTFVTGRQEPGAAQIVVTDEQFQAMKEEYQREALKFKTRQDALQYEQEGYFMPLNTYSHKLMLKSGKVLRPLFQGEVGMMGASIVVLERGYGTGGQFAVKEKLS